MGPQPSRRLAAVLVGSVLVLAAGTAAAATAAVAETAYDVRVRDRSTGAAHVSVGIVQRDPLRGGVRMIADRDGFLTGPRKAPPARIALDYVRRRAAVFRLDPSELASLELTRRYTSTSGATHLLWQQTFRGIPLFDQGLRANVAADGRLINIGGSPRPELTVASVEPRLTAREALRAFGRGRGDRAALVLFGDAARMRLAWRLLVRVDSQHVYDAVVDAATGAMLYRHNLVRHATGLAFENYPGAAAGGTQASRVFPGTGPDPWLTSSTRLLGDNAHVYSDEEDRIDGDPPDAAGPQPGDEIPPSAPGAWNYVHDARSASSPGQDCPPIPGCSWSNFDTTFSWRENREQAGTQLFYFVNRFHDHLRDAAGIGFDDSSGNFEAADRVHAQVDDGAATDTGAFDDFPDCDHINNASVIPLPDGEPLLLQVYLWSSACEAGSQLHDVNAADDPMIVYHEYTHGMTNRLVTDPQGFSGLTGPQSGAMDEGLADWYALDFLNALGVEPDSAAPGELRAGKYLNDDELRTQPFDCPVGAPASACPGTPNAGPGGYTYGDFGRILGTPEVHADGEIWAETLWDLRAALIAAHGRTGGIDRSRALVTDGLRLSPANPSFLDMRNAILQADVNRGLGDWGRIWAVFAARGMGVGASTTGDFDTSPVEDFSVPPQPAPPLPSPPSDEVDPVVSRFSLAHRRFRVGFNRTPVATRRRFPVGTRFRFRLSEPATVTIAIERSLPGRRVGRRCRRPSFRLRHRPRCTRHRPRGALTRRDLPAGRNRVAFSGRIGVRALRAGRYRATISAVDAAGNESRKRRAAFRIVPR